jgi:S-DNA-T family DNA segregation ATPase FtsK/SpoIIIE
MAEDGVVGEYKGSQAREVLITMEEWAARTGSEPLPPDPAPRKLKIQPHAETSPAVATFENDEDEDDWEADDLGDVDAFEDDDSER